MTAACLINTLPVEIFKQITSYLNFPDKKSLQLASRRTNWLVGNVECRSAREWLWHLKFTAHHNRHHGHLNVCEGCYESYPVGQPNQHLLAEWICVHAIFNSWRSATENIADLSKMPVCGPCAEILHRWKLHECRRERMKNPELLPCRPAGWWGPQWITYLKRRMGLGMDYAYILAGPPSWWKDYATFNLYRTHADRGMSVPFVHRRSLDKSFQDC